MLTWLAATASIALGVGAGVTGAVLALLSLARLDEAIRGWARRGRALPRFRAWVRRLG